MAAPRTDWIEAELEDLCSSAEFATSPRLVRLLLFCVEQSRLNQFENLKESTIGVAVFGREPSYDTKADPIVRVSAGRLRKKLDAFYRRREQGSPVIYIPKGSYIAHFLEVVNARADETARFTESAHLTEPPQDTSIGGRGEEEPAAQARPASLRRRMPALMVGTAALLLVFVWGSSRRAETSSLPIELLAALPGTATDPAWSPDGETLAFEWNGGAVRPSQIYLLKRGDSVPVRLTDSDQRERRPAWSPDGRQIALLRETSKDQCSLVLVRRSDTPGRKAERVIRAIAQSRSRHLR